MKIVINNCFGGFGLSDEGYEKLIEWGVPVQRYVPQERDLKTNLYLPQPANDGEVIFDRDLTEAPSASSLAMRRLDGRYHDGWLRESRSHALLVRLVEELGSAASGNYANLKVVEVPEGVDWEISEYDGSEHVAEVHRTWR